MNSLFVEIYDNEILDSKTFIMTDFEFNSLNYDYTKGSIVKYSLNDKSFPSLFVDTDGDEVVDLVDKCPSTFSGEQLIYGCSCEQILELKPGEDTAENREGCSRGIIDVFTKAIGWAKDLF